MSIARSAVLFIRPGLIALVFLLVPLCHGDERNFWALNNTGKTITEIYVAPHEAKSWGPNTLGETEMPDGTGALVLFAPEITSSCNMDIKLVFADGTNSRYTSWNVCKLRALEFRKGESFSLRFVSH